MKDRGCRSWAELPSSVTSSILHRLGAIEILENAQKLCTSWRRVCKDPSMWRKIVMHDLGYLRSMGYGLGMDEYGNLGNPKYNLDIMCRHAVDRSPGGLLEIEFWYFGNDSLLTYVAERSSNLRSLRLVMCYTITSEGLIQAILKLPLLQDLELTYFLMTGESLKFVGQSCPNLKTLKLNRMGYRQPLIEYDEEALAVAATMSGLRYLQLFGNKLTDAGLNAILDSCPKLEHLDLRQCFNVNLVEDLEKRCFQRTIKVVRRPNDSTHDYPYDATVGDQNPSDDEYSSYDDDEFSFIPGFY